MFRQARWRLLRVALGVCASLAVSNALAQTHAQLIQQLESEGATLRQKLGQLDRNSQTILTLHDERARLPYAEDVNKGAAFAAAASTAKEIDEKIQKLKRENGLLMKEVNAGLAYVVSLAINSSVTAQDFEDIAASRRAAGTCPESVARSAGSAHTVVAPFSAPARPPPVAPPMARPNGSVGNGTGDAR